MPLATKPIKLTLTAELTGTPVQNAWEVWVFPRPAPVADAGKGIGASPGVYAAIKDRYPGLTEVSTPAGQGPDLLLVERLDGKAAQALEMGKTVIVLRLPGVVPGIELGWWGIREQAGTAIARHPAFGDFPHDGYLNELLFRLIGRTASPNDEALHQVEPLMVGRGIQGYLIHVFQAKAGKGKLLASGLGLLSTNPEAVYLLDQFIRYARSPQFQPRGQFDPNHGGPAWRELTALAESLNGWSETLQASECRPYSSFLGQYSLCLAR